MTARRLAPSHDAGCTPTKIDDDTDDPWEATDDDEYIF